jgi:hypothetical protein
MQIVELEEYISLIVSTVKRNFPLNSNYFYPSRNNNDLLKYKYLSTPLTNIRLNKIKFN